MRRLAPAVIGVLLMTALWPEASSAEPTRLRVSVDATSVTIGSRTPVVLEFLDRDFRPVDNDRDRSVRLETRSTKGTEQGHGDVSPTPVNVPAGARRFSAIHFTARAAGTVLIRATSDGLAPGEVVVRVRAGEALVSRLLFPVVHAQASRSFEILPREHEPFPLNDQSTAQFSICVDDPVPPGRRISYRIDTEPAVRIRYGKNLQLEGVGIATIEIAEGQFQSEPFHVSAPAGPGAVSIRARVLPNGETQQTQVSFVAPRPVHVGLEARHYTVSSHERVVPLQVQLLDADRLPLNAVTGSHVITLESASGSESFEPPSVTLSSTKPKGSAELHLPSVRLGGALRILARWEDVDTAEVELNVMAAVWVLLFLATFGGFLGGLARHVYRVGTPHIWPQFINGRLEPGLLGNALFSALSGLVLFQAIELGILHSLDQLQHVHGSATLAFVLGVTGGFAGVVVFEVLTSRVLPAKAQAQA
ncbi:MAG: hypothetical protein GEU99_22560 [Luteitalea sp.]|nr:hypothetical protein [Luteitalea sp.]